MSLSDAFVVDGTATPAAHRCEEEYKVLVENAARALVRSEFGALL